jgi:hypothetical protein
MSKREAFARFCMTPEQFFSRAGWVYVVKNEHMPSVRKIGRTYRCPLKRASELRATAVPGEFKLTYSDWYADCDEAERFIHELLKSSRVDEKREFFEYDSKIILRAFADYNIAECIPEHMWVQYHNRRTDAQSRANHRVYGRILSEALA